MNWLIPNGTERLDVIDSTFITSTNGTSMRCHDIRSEEEFSCPNCQKSAEHGCGLLELQTHMATRYYIVCVRCTIHLALSTFYRTGVKVICGTYAVISNNLYQIDHRLARALEHDKYVFTGMRYLIADLIKNPIHHKRLIVFRKFTEADISWYIMLIYIDHHMVGLTC